MELRDAQARIDAWIRDHGGYWDEWANLARMTEELGEVAAALQRLRGLRPRKTTVDLPGELGDLLFVTLAFANQQGIDLAAALAATLAKVEARDGAAWKAKVAADAAAAEPHATP